MHLFHKWKKYNEKVTDIFLGEQVFNVFPQYRQCTVCGKVQEYTYDSGGGNWYTIDAQRTAIFNRKKDTL